MLLILFHLKLIYIWMKTTTVLVSFPTGKIFRQNRLNGKLGLILSQSFGLSLAHDHGCKSQWSERKEMGHIALVISTQRAQGHLLSSLSPLSQARSLCLGIGGAQSGLVLWPPLIIHHTCAQRPSFQWFQIFANLTVNTIHHNHHTRLVTMTLDGILL